MSNGGPAVVAWVVGGILLGLQWQLWGLLPCFFFFPFLLCLERARWSWGTCLVLLGAPLLVLVLLQKNEREESRKGTNRIKEKKREIREVESFFYLIVVVLWYEEKGVFIGLF